MDFILPYGGRKILESKLLIPIVLFLIEFSHSEICCSHYLWSSIRLNDRRCDCLLNVSFLLIFQNRWVCFDIFSNAKK
jgi:hypothetical protein